MQEQSWGVFGGREWVEFPETLARLGSRPGDGGPGLLRGVGMATGAPAPSRSDERSQADDAERIHPVRRPEVETELVAENEIANRWAEVVTNLAEPVNPAARNRQAI